jgi:hypothetical protein
MYAMPIPFQALKIQRTVIYVALLQAVAVSAPVAVRHTEGLVHGFLVLSTLEGKPIAQGDLIQTSVKDRVTSHLVFRFKDGSLRDERAVFSQSGSFRLLAYHLIQKGPAFDRPMETAFDSSSGLVNVTYTEHDGKQKVATDHVKLPPDVANGIIFTLMKNILPGEPLTMVSMVATTPKPRLVKLAITPHSEEPFFVVGSKRMAIHYVLKVEIGGFAGAIAPLMGKQPPDIHIWILGGEAPAFVKMEGPLYYGGPAWRIELASPVWPAAVPAYVDKSKGAEVTKK